MADETSTPSAPSTSRPEGSGPGGPGGRPPGGRPSGPGGGGRKFFRRKKVCKFCVEKIDAIHYRDVRLLQQFVAERGKIVPRRLTGVWRGALLALLHAGLHLRQHPRIRQRLRPGRPAGV